MICISLVDSSLVMIVFYFLLKQNTIILSSSAFLSFIVCKRMLIMINNKFPKIIFMKPSPQSTAIAASINQNLLKKALTILSRRQMLFKNMNLYSLDQLSKIIQEINSQQSLKILPTCITESDDHESHPYDNMMSMSEVKLMNYPNSETNTHPSLIHKDSKTLATTKSNLTNKKDQPNKDKLSFMDLLEDIDSSRGYITSIRKQQIQEQSEEIEAFRVIKEQEYEQLLLEKQLEQKKRPPLLINLNNQRVIYGYDSKIVKLEKVKQRKNMSISQINPNIINPQALQSKKDQFEFNYNRKIPINITNKVNITQKQAQEQLLKQKQKERRAKKYHTSTVTQEPTTINIRMNPQSHKEFEQALAIKQKGVKVSIQKREFSADKYTPSNRITKRITRSEYLQIRSNQQIKQDYYRQNINDKGKGKVYSEGRLKTQNAKQQKSSSNSGKRYKLSFNTFYNLPKKDKSQIFTHNPQAKAQLLTQTKEKPFLFQTINEHPSSSSLKQNQLSHIDRYNLMYIKYKGNPPNQQNLLSALRSQQKMIRESKTGYSKSISNDSRLIKQI